MFSTQQYSGFDPRTIPGCALWLDAADSNAFTFSSGSNVATWKDKSQNLLTGTASNSPTRVDNRINGLPAVVLNGSTQYFNLGTGLSLGTNGVYIFAVVQYSSSSGSIIGKYNDNYIDWSMRRNTNANIFDIGYSVINENFTLYTDSTTTPQLYASYFDTATIFQRQNGTQRNTLSFEGGNMSEPIDNVYVGVRYDNPGTPRFFNYFSGNIGEIIVFISLSMTLAQIQGVEGYLASKWGLRTNIPTVHPFRSNPVFTRPFRPIDISSCSLWLDAADYSTFTFSSGSNISQWRDKSINGSIGDTQVTTGVSPTLTQSAQNNLPAVSFTGGARISYGNILTLNNNKIYIFSVANITGSGGTVISKGRLNSTIGSFGLFRDTDKLYMGVTPSGSTSYAIISDISTNTRLLSGSWDRSTLRLFRDGTNVASTSVVNSTTLTGTGEVWVGGLIGFPADYLNGRIMEVVVYIGDMTTIQQQQLEGYLTAKWGISDSLPTTQPFYLQRALPNTPIFDPRFVSGINAWFDGADPNGNGIPPAANSSVSTWVNKSGGTNGTASGTVPTYSSNGITFASGNYTTSIPYTSNYSIFLVATNTTTTQCYFFARDALGGGRGPTITQGYTNTTRLQFYEGDGGVFPVIQDPTVSPFIASVDYRNLGSINLYYNGSNTSNTTSTSSFNSTAWDRIGSAGSGGAAYTGTIKDLIFFSNVVSTDDRQKIEGYLAWKWGLQNSLPTTHPYYKFRP